VRYAILCLLCPLTLLRLCFPWKNSFVPHEFEHWMNSFPAIWSIPTRREETRNRARERSIHVRTERHNTAPPFTAALQELKSAQCANRCSNSTRITAKPPDKPSMEVSPFPTHIRVAYMPCAPSGPGMSCPSRLRGKCGSTSSLRVIFLSCTTFYLRHARPGRIAQPQRRPFPLPARQEPVS
ncbi:hypothetical protein B0H13DRAFT_2527566, partial [Mycena leptocephala]